MATIVKYLIELPEYLSRPFTALGPLFARITVGWVFMWAGWAKLTHLPQVIENFVEWGIPLPHVLTPFVSAVEFGGGLFLLLGLFTRIVAPPLVIIMIVAIISAKWDQIDSLETLLGFEEVAYMALFGWLAVAGPGPVSLDEAVKRTFSPEQST